MARDSWELGQIGIRIPDMRELTDFLETYCEDELQALASEYPTKQSFYIRHYDLYKFSEGLVKAFEMHFSKIEPVIKEALADAGALKYRDDIEEISENVKIRVCAPLPALKQSIRDLGKKDIGKLVCVDGYARLVSDANPRGVSTVFECMRCGHLNTVYHNGNKFTEPSFCENEICGKKGPFVEDESQSVYVDLQRIQIQELPDSTVGSKPQDIMVECEEDITNIVKPGDRVTVIGILKLKPKYANGGRTTLNEKIIHALSIEKKDLGFDEYILTQSDEDKIIDLSKDPEVIEKIINSVAPSIHGNEDIKEAVALQLFGGVEKFLPDGTKQRGAIHLGLIGDPGGAKTRFLKRAVQISPRGVYASGKSTSAAGLTAAAVKDPLNEGSWVLEGGAAVMASGGILAIDEAGQAKEEDKSALLEVMEDGTISVAKAGNVTTLKANCGVILAGNPDSGYFDRFESFARQVNLPPALWSRVTLTFIMLDTPEVKKDIAISQHILRNHRIGGMIQNREHSKEPLYSESEIEECKKEIEAPVSEELLRMYIAYARMYIYPVASEEISEEISNFYVDVRKLKLDDPNCPVPITPRTVEDLQRLAEARARMRLSNVITHEDVAAAKRIMIESLKQVGMDENGRLDAGIQYIGVSKSQSDKIKLLTETIRLNEMEDDILRIMNEKHGVKTEITKDYLKKLSRDGKIYRSKAGGWKTVQ